MKISEPILFKLGKPTHIYAYIIQYKEMDSLCMGIGFSFIYRLVILDISENVLILDKFFLKAKDARFHMASNFRKLLELHVWTRFSDLQQYQQKLKTVTEMDSYFNVLQLSQKGDYLMEVSIVENFDLAASFAFIMRFRTETDRKYELFAVSYGRSLKKQFDTLKDAKGEFDANFGHLFGDSIPKWSSYFTPDEPFNLSWTKISLLKFSPIYTQASTITYILDTQRDKKRYRLVVYNLVTDSIIYSKYHSMVDSAKRDFMKKFKAKGLSQVWTDFHYPGDLYEE
jgi:hypothetical protein